MMMEYLVASFPAAASVMAAALLVAIAAASVAASTPGPMATVQTASDRIIEILSDPKVPKQERWTHIAPVIASNFDFQAMSMRILSRDWRSATSAQQKEFVNYFSQYIEGTYRSKIEAYSGQRIEYTGEKLRGERAAVTTVIHTESTRIPVSYYLRQGRAGEWKAYDITIEGVSLVNSYRELYGAISKTSGISGVLAHVKRRVAEQQSAPDSPTRQ